jgi:hypothetical protein
MGFTFPPGSDMAETSYHSSPKLTPTADDQPYAPISWLAVAAGVSALVFVIVFVALAIFSFTNKQPMIMPALLILPVVTFVLAFAAYSHVKNSEGTRTDTLFGMNLVRTAGAVALVGGAGYVAYLGALEFAVRKDAENVFLAWTEGLKNLPEGEGLEAALAKAVHQTLEPAAQQKVSATDVATIRAAYGEQYVQFSQCDLVRVCRRNPGAVTVKPQGLVNWEREQQKVKCTLNADLVSPEGVHTISVEMQADTAPSGARLWGMQNKPAYVIGRRLTPYGKRVEDLEISAALVAQRFLEPMGPQVASRIPDETDKDLLRRRAFVDFVANPFPPAQSTPTLPVLLRAALAGGTAAAPTLAPGYEAELTNRIFVPLLPAAGLGPDDRARLEKDMREKFLAIWSGHRFLRTGTLLRSSKEIFPILTADDKAIRVTMPFELVLPGSETAANTSRGRMTLECKDPAIVSDLAKLRAAANPATAQPGQMPEFPKDNVTWQLTRIESDLKPGPQPQMGMTGDAPPG